VVKEDGHFVAMAQLGLVRPRELNLGIAHLHWGPFYERIGVNGTSPTLEKVAKALYDEQVVRRGLYLKIYQNSFKSTSRTVEWKQAFARHRQDLAREPTR